MENITKITIVDAENQAQWGKPTGRNYVRPTQTERAHIALNCYEPGVNDELHCHPGSDHTFFVVQGECTMKGLKEGGRTLANLGRWWRFTSRPAFSTSSTIPGKNV